MQETGFDPQVEKIPWRREWQPTPVFLSGKFHGQRSLAGYSPYCHKVWHNWATNTSQSSFFLLPLVADLFDFNVFSYSTNHEASCWKFFLFLKKLCYSSSLWFSFCPQTLGALWFCWEHYDYWTCSSFCTWELFLTRIWGQSTCKLGFSVGCFVYLQPMWEDAQ